MLNKIIHLIIVGFGPVASYKYIRFIQKLIKKDKISSYSIVDLKSQESLILNKLKSISIKPIDILFINNEYFNKGSNKKGLHIFDTFCKKQREGKKNLLKVLISTEAQAHELYLNYCIEEGIDSLTTKPILLPMKNNTFNYAELTNKMLLLLEKSELKKANHSVLVLGREHKIFKQKVMKPIKKKMKELNIPITSIHLKTASGVWNMIDEFETREDHPYKYGYGMLMHGGYHYVDMLVQFLKLNKKIYNTDKFFLEINTFSAYPKEQDYRLPVHINSKLKRKRKLLNNFDEKYNYGETDIVINFSLKNQNDKVLTLGTFSMEQTTPGIRSWLEFPNVSYNINGRMHSTDLDIRLSTLYSINGHVHKRPINAKINKNDLRGKSFGRVTVRSNAFIANTQYFYKEEVFSRPYGNSFSYSAELKIFKDWLIKGKTTSSLSSHLDSMKLLEAIAKTLYSSNNNITIELFSNE